MRKTKLPTSFKKYFWDVDFNKLNPQNNASYIILRLLDRGDAKVISWLVKNYPKGLIKEIIINRRGLSPKTAVFWALLLGIDQKKVVCLQTPYLKMRQELWPY